MTVERFCRPEVDVIFICIFGPDINQVRLLTAFTGDLVGSHIGPVLSVPLS